MQRRAIGQMDLKDINRYDLTEPNFMLCKMFLFPIKTPAHWSLAVADTGTRVIDIIDSLWKTQERAHLVAQGAYIQSWFNTQYSIFYPGQPALIFKVRVVRAPEQWNGMGSVSQLCESACAPVEVRRC